jgi:diguanylate cyclase (GGDEF)-like protein
LLVADGAGIVFLSSHPHWRFRALEPLPAATHQALQRSRAYGDRPLLTPLSEDIKGLESGAGVVRLRGQGRFVALSERLPGPGWRLLVLTPTAAFSRTFWLFTLLGLLLALSLGGLVLLWVFRELYQRGVLRAAIRDPLTGLYTRLYMNETVPRLIARQNRFRRLTLGLIIFDIDHFKQINDRFGHIAGDRVLADIGALLRAQCDDGDIAVRLGGEELAVFLLRDTPGGASRLAERVRLLVQASAVPWKQTQIAVTVSGGVAEHRSGETMVQLLQRADRALYQAKRCGRNRVILCDSVTELDLPPGLASQLGTGERRCRPR